MTPDEVRARMDALVSEHPELKRLPWEELATLAGYLDADGDGWVLDPNGGEGP